MLILDLLNIKKFNILSKNRFLSNKKKSINKERKKIGLESVSKQEDQDDEISQHQHSQGAHPDDFEEDGPLPWVIHYGLEDLW